MSSPFPQIRTKGDKDACGQYTKRAMLELFKTQDLQERMGVPIFKRTVPVNDYTEIEVQVVHDQKFIEIRCFPPSRGLEPSGEKDKEFDTRACPAAFVVRKLDIDAKQGTGFTPDKKQQGYIIAYNHARKKWEIASYQDGTGSTNTFASCSNIGWWHARDDRDGYTGCDVVTWYGTTFFDFTAPFMPRIYVDDETGRPDYEIPAVTALQKCIMFKGRRFLTPNHVLGACIIDVAGVDYMYVHTCNLTEQDAGYKITWEYSIRCKLSTLFSAPADGTNVPWESGGSLYVPDKIQFERGPGFVDTRKWWAHPIGTAYVDKDGYSYVMHRAYLNRYTSPEEQYVNSDICHVWVKYNLRDMGHEILWDPTAPENRTTLNSSSNGLNTSTGGGHYPISCVGNIGQGHGEMHVTFEMTHDKHPVYQWAGTKDHYVLWVDRSWSGFYDYERDFDGIDEWQSTVGGATIDSYLTLTKNGQEVERFPAQFVHSSGSVNSSFIDWERTCEFTDASCETMNLAITQWHPDIDESFFALKKHWTDLGAHFTASKVTGKNRNEEWIYGESFNPEIYEDNGVDFGYRNLSMAQRDFCAGDGFYTFSTYFNKELVWDANYYTNRVFELGSHATMLSPLNEIYPLETGPGGIIFSAAQIGTDCYQGVIANTYYHSQRTLGSAVGFWVPRKAEAPGFSGNERSVPLEGYAVHHLIEIDGVRQTPYIYLQRPLNLTNNPFSWGLSYVQYKEVWHSQEDYDWMKDVLTLQSPVGVLVTERLGGVVSADPAIEGHQMNVANWKVKSNVLSEAQIKQLTKETDNMLLEIGVL